MSPTSVQELDAAVGAGSVTAVTPSPRYHSLDALRATMMMLGLVLHAACSYTTFPMDEAWVFKDQRTSHFADLLVVSIHTFRMPVFMVMAGFFAALLAQGRGLRAFIGHRVRRVLVPFVVSFVLIIPLLKWAACYAQGRGVGLAAPAWEGMRHALGEPYGTLGHLWFLYDLLLFYCLVVLLRPLLPARFKQAAARWFSQAMKRGGGLFILPLLPFFAVTTALCCFMLDGVLGTSLGFVPDLPLLGVYFAFFGFGWLLYAARDCLPLLQERLVVKGLLLLVLIAVRTAILAQGERLFAEPGFSPWLVASAATGMGAAWMGFSFWAGLFLRYFDQPSVQLRYLTDASYAVYLIHLPLVYLTAGWMAPWQVSAALKLSAVLVVVAALSLVFYATCVRRTFIGQGLNGRRYG